MTQPHEVLSDTNFVDENGEVKPYADVADSLDSHPTSDVSIAQGITNLDNWRKEQSVVEQGERMLRQYREHKLMEVALQNAGPYETLDEHRRTVTALVDAAADISMYKGGEKGGFATEDFRERYEPDVPQVVRGAKQNHRKVVNEVLPRLYKAAELKDVGFDSYDVDDDVNAMRVKLLKQYGGPENKKTRADTRARYK